MRNIELLAPVGGIQQYIAAVENGADAVYLGGTLYNARMNAANFTLPELEKALDYGHLRGVKTYVTMNTLLDDSELCKAVEYAKKLYAIGVDALIIQDMGLVKLVHEALPDFPLHLSTQATVYNFEGVKQAKKLGCSRVVLARELSIEEISKCTVDKDVEIEVFVHGALCMCYSGQCQLSRFIGGRSGNKGSCAQPCRLPYGNGYPLSPKDLCMIDHIGDLIESGVKSFKIEGRMKSPEYVATVVRIYRKYIDEYLKNGSYTVLDEDRKDLLQVFNRGGFTSGYAYGDPQESLLSGMLPKNQGIYAGKIERANKDGFTALARIDAQLEMGDVIEVHTRDTFTTKVTYYNAIDRNHAVIGDMKAAVYPGDDIYRIVSDDLMKRARETFEQTEFDSGKFKRRTAVDFTLNAMTGSELCLGVRIALDGKRFQAKATSKDFTVEEARARGTTEDDIRAQLSKTGGTPFELGKCRLIMDENVYIPLSKLNELRRNALNELSREIKNGYKREIPESTDSLAAEGKNAISAANAYDSTQRARFELQFESLDAFQNADMQAILKSTAMYGIESSAVYAIIPIKDAVENIEKVEKRANECGISVIPQIFNVTKGKTDDWVLSDKAKIIETAKRLGGRIYIGNISAIESFSGIQGLTVLSDYGLNIYNEESFKAYESLGAYKGIKSLESFDNTSGAFPLMVTEHEIKENTLTDRKGVEYDINFDDFSHKTVIRAKNAVIDWSVSAARLKSGENVRVFI